MGLRTLVTAAALLVPVTPAWAGDGGAAPGPAGPPVPASPSGGAAPGTGVATPPRPRPRPARAGRRPAKAAAHPAKARRPKGRRPKPPSAPPAPPPPRRPKPSPPPPIARGGTFPVAGPHSFGGRDALFGAPRRRHVHQGQDVSAPSGTPLVAPRAGRVAVRGNQPSGAGLYYVIAGDDGRHYVLMHLLSGSMLVPEGARVAAGQAIGAVGSTGASSGPHLHFEIWVGGWRTPGGVPIDPLPELRRWDAYS